MVARQVGAATAVCHHRCMSLDSPTSGTRARSSLMAENWYRPQPIPEGLLQRVVEAQKLRNPPPPPRSTRSFDPIPPCELQAQLADALNHISADDYEAWWRVGAALHQELGESTGYLLWVRWSATSSKFSEAVCECKWRTFARGCAQPLTRGFVFQQAKLNGWQPPRRQRGKPLTW